MKKYANNSQSNDEMRNDEYNGWSNYETWCVKLWIDNEQHLQEYWLGRASEALDQGKGALGEMASELGEWLNDERDDAIEQLEGYGMAVDLLASAMSRADTYEIAENFLESARELTK